MMVQAIRFLHHFVVSGDLNLRERLHRAPMRKFNGLIHTFIETFGRLSYAGRADWITGEDKQAWEKVAGKWCFDYVILTDLVIRYGSVTAQPGS